MMNELAIAEIFNQVIGLSCRRILFAEPGILVIFIGDIIQSDPIKTVWSLHIDCTWKISEEGKLLVGSFDPPSEANSNAQKLKALTISKIEFDSTLGDICITFEEIYKLYIFTYSRQDEHWQLRKSDGFRLTFGPDAEWTAQYHKAERGFTGQRYDVQFSAGKDC